MFRPRDEITDGFDLLIDLIEQRAASVTVADNATGPNGGNGSEEAALELRVLERNKKLVERLLRRWTRCRNSLADIPSKDGEKGASGDPADSSGRTRLSLR